MKILVAGGAGFVGTNLIKRLLKDKHEVHAVDNYSTGFKSNHQDGCTYHEYDLASEHMLGIYVEGKTVLASKAGRAPYPIAGIIGADMNDLQYIEELIKRAKSIGFTGVALIHPKHVAIANRIFRLTEEEVTYHRQLIESYEEGIKKGLGAVRFRDAMIDQAMYERSMELLSNQT